jgi:hypothetical protein
MIRRNLNNANNFANSNSGTIGDGNSESVQVVSTLATYHFMSELDNIYGEIGEVELGQYYHKIHNQHH